LVIASITWSVRSAGTTTSIFTFAGVHVTPHHDNLSLASAVQILHLGHGEALHTQRRQRLAHVVELEGLDDGHISFIRFP